VSWEAIAGAKPEVVVVMPCGYDAPRAHEEALAHAERLRSLGASRIFAVDAAAYFSRPGPRLVDGLELLGALLHPELLGGVALEGRAVELATATPR
jgi:iron complex transport system substrate-binding protein